MQYPNEAAKKAMMACARSKKNPNNSFFISTENGGLVKTAYRDDKGYFPSIPKGTYEVHILKEPFLSYDQLDEIIEAQTWSVREEERVAEDA